MKKTNVLHVVSNLNHGGAETMIMNIYRNIDKEKVHFDFLCLSSIEGKYEQEIEKLGGNIYKVLPSENKLKKLYKILKENNYNVIHSHVMFYTGFINFIAKKSGIKIRIAHSHSSSDIKKETIIRKMYISITRFLLNRYSNVKISCGEKAGKYLYGNNEEFIILKNGIDLEKFMNVTEEQVNNLKKELNIEKDDLVIGHVGSFIEVKNQEYFIEFAKELVKQNKKFKIILVGQGKRKEYIEQLIKKENLQDYFIMPGIRDDVPVFMNIFDILIMPSLYEGFPLVVVEALAGNCICFLSNNISKETNIINTRVQYFELEGDIHLLIKRIQEGLQNKSSIDIRKILIEKGFSIKEMTQKISNIYLQL